MQCKSHYRLRFQTRHPQAAALLQTESLSEAKRNENSVSSPHSLYAYNQRASRNAHSASPNVTRVE